MQANDEAKPARERFVRATPLRLLGSTKDKRKPARDARSEKQVQLSCATRATRVACIRIHSCCGCGMKVRTRNRRGLPRKSAEMEKLRISRGFSLFCRVAVLWQGAHAAVR